MASTAPPPLLRDTKLDLIELQRSARTFDAIGDEIGGARYPAVAFVKWLADEYARPAAAPRHDGGGLSA